MKILLSEGASLTSRETLTVLGAGFEVDILSSSKYGISRFSKFCRHYFQGHSPNKIDMYLKEIITLNSREKYDVLLPIHEEGWLLSSARYELKEIPLLLSPPEAYEQVQGKISFAYLLDQLAIPQPKWCLYQERKEWSTYPCWIKADFSTAGRGVLRVESYEEMNQGIYFFANKGMEELMIQENIDGDYGQVQAMFKNGRLVAIHSNLKNGSGVGGSAAARISIDSALFVEPVRKIGQAIEWSGGITFDFIKNENGFYFIECNPRMVEPGNAAAAGINFPKLLIDLTLSEPDLPYVLMGRSGIKTHSTLGLLMGCAEKTRKRRKLVKVLAECMFHRGERWNSREVLTPIWKDWKSAIPLIIGTFRLLIQPSRVEGMTEEAVAHYRIDPKTIMKLKERGL